MHNDLFIKKISSIFTKAYFNMFIKVFNNYTLQVCGRIKKHTVFIKGKGDEWFIYAQPLGRESLISHTCFSYNAGIH